MKLTRVCLCQQIDVEQKIVNALVFATIQRNAIQTDIVLTIGGITQTIELLNVDKGITC